MGEFWELPWALDYWIAVMPNEFVLPWFREVGTPVPCEWYTTFVHPEAEC